jgi:hypothetical protein
MPISLMRNGYIIEEMPPRCETRWIKARAEFEMRWLRMQAPDLGQAFAQTDLARPSLTTIASSAEKDI